jgi:uncharacterized protein
MKKLLGALGAAFVLAASLAPAQTLPPKPKLYFNDYAGFVPAADGERLNQKLARFDQETTNQILVAIFPSLPSPSLEDFTARTAQSWKPGQGDRDNGIVVFVFVADRKSRIEVGYGLEGAVPDAVAARILNDVITPAFRDGRNARGLEAGIDALIAATRGEYTAAPKGRRPTTGGGAALLVMLLLLVPLFVVFNLIARRMPAGAFDSAGFDHPTIPFSSPGARRRRRRSSYWGGGGWGGGGFGGGGGGGGFGGFSGGGGSFGGGGASGSW